MNDNGNGNGDSKLIMKALIGVAAAICAGYAAWLGNSVTTLQQSVVRIETKVDLYLHAEEKQP